jgi:hypothetical protein
VEGYNTARPATINDTHSFSHCIVSRIVNREKAVEVCVVSRVQFMENSVVVNLKLDAFREFMLEECYA